MVKKESKEQQQQAAMEQYLDNMLLTGMLPFEDKPHAAEEQLSDY